MIDETNAANSGGDQPDSGDSSVWMKSMPKRAWSLLSMRPYMCVPQAVQAWRLIVALGSTTFSFCSLAVTLTLSRPVTATIENSAPCGFQHLVQPHTWLCADWPVIETVTLLLAHLQDSVPPAKLGAAALMPLSTAGWMEVAI